MAKVSKSEIYGEYIIADDEKHHISVYRIFDNAKAALREATEAEGFAYDPNWTTRQFGKKMCQQFGDGMKCQVGNYFIHILENGSVEIYRTYDNTKGALREIAEKIGFAYDKNWTTQQLGSKLIKELEKK